MILIAPIGNPLMTAERLAEQGFDISVAPEGKYLRAYPTTVAAEAA